MLPIRTIVYPTDFSKRSAYAFQLACALARDYGARLFVLYVKPPPVVMGEFGAVPPEPEDPEALKQTLNEYRPADPSLRVEHILVEGDPATEILREARERAADLIVMGTHGRTGLSRLLLGSVAELVLRKAPCPVLTIKAPLAAGEAVAARAAEAMSPA